VKYRRYLSRAMVLLGLVKPECALVLCWATADMLKPTLVGILRTGL
jgi:hypothetical protein